MHVFKVLGMVIVIPAALLSVALIATVLWSFTSSSLGIQSFKAGVAYSTSNDLSPVTLRISGEDAKFRLSYPRAAGSDQASVRGGYFSQARLSYTWPELTPLGAAPERRLGRRVVLKGFEFSRIQHLRIALTSRHFIGKAYTKRACRKAKMNKLLEKKHFDLIAIDTSKGRNSGRLKIDGTRGNLRALMPAPLNQANEFFYLPESPQEAAHIVCGETGCRAEMGWHDVRVEVGFDSWDLANWKLYTDTARKILDEALQNEITLKNDPPNRVQKNECPILDRFTQ